MTLPLATNCRLRHLGLALFIASAALLGNHQTEAGVSGDGSTLVWLAGPKESGVSLGLRGVMIREFHLPHRLIQMDVIDESGSTMSFLATYGITNRAMCEAIHATEEDWLVYCDVYDLPLSSWQDVAGNQLKGRYLLSSELSQCGPIRVDMMSPTDLALLVSYEVSSWPSDQRALLGKSWFKLGTYGAPRIGELLQSHFRLPVSSFILSEDTLDEVDEVPDDLRAALRVNKLTGLGGWLESAITDLP